jgi:uncharacterized membrane protein YhhN
MRRTHLLQHFKNVFMKKINYAVLFWAVALVHLFCIYMNWPQQRVYSKFILVPILMWYLFKSPESDKPLKGMWRAYLGLFFSWVGDVLLIGEGPSFFLSGMIAFITAHVYYSLFFIQTVPVKKETAAVFYKTLIGLSVVCGVLFLLLRSALGAYQVPILFYMLFISLMASLAVHTTSNATYKNFALQTFVPGALLFVISDVLLATNKFYSHLPVFDLGVMLTYAGAQYFLTKGFISIKKVSHL